MRAVATRRTSRMRGTMSVPGRATSVRGIELCVSLPPCSNEARAIFPKARVAATTPDARTRAGTRRIETAERQLRDREGKLFRATNRTE